MFIYLLLTDQSIYLSFNSYTLECNYNSGRHVNTITTATMDSGRCSPPQNGSPIPHKLTSLDFEEVCFSRTYVHYFITSLLTSIIISMLHYNPIFY